MKFNTKLTKTCLEYSENPEKLKELMENIDIFIDYTRQIKSFGRGLVNQVVKVTIHNGNNRQKHSFDFHLSHVDTEALLPPETRGSGHKKKKSKVLKETIYNVLSCCKSDYYMDYLSFTEFCAEFGYDEDSIKDKRIWVACGEQAAGLQKVFSEELIEVLPD